MVDEGWEDVFQVDFGFLFLLVDGLIKKRRRGRGWLGRYEKETARWMTVGKMLSGLTLEFFLY